MLKSNFLALLTACAGAAATAEVPIPIASHLQLFVDARLIASSRGTQLRQHPPQPREVVLTLDAPWEGPLSGYVTMMQDGDLFRMYYRGGGETTEEVVCMATSRDGVRWERPDLGLVEFKKSKANNILLRGQRKAYWEAHNFTPFKDTNPAAPAESRYKALTLGRHTPPGGDRQKALLAMHSPDGVHWKHIRAEPVITKGSFDSQNTAFWDATRREYVAYVRDGRTTPDGRSVRSVLRATSKDFLNWTEPVWLDFGDSTLEQFYVNNIAPYPREPSLYLGFPMRFVPERKTVGADARVVDGVSDAVLISSRDGLRFDRTFMEAFLRPGLDAQNWGNAHGNNTPAWGLLTTTTNELSLYWNEHYGAPPRIRRGTLRVDGFASVNAPFAGGEFVTRPLTFTGGKLVLNYSTSAVGSVRVELQDANGLPLDGFKLDDSAEIYGDETARTVAWKSSPDLARHAGKPVRLRVVMKDADLFSFRFAP
ncbi:MAG: hypothetical protein HZA92_03970 [Verrucomicrobia bacterium]|nr:hypothetical protein [Verrucomicrobiota bacterium]